MELVGNTFAFPWEVNLLVWLQSNLSPSLISIISKFSFFGEEIFLILVLGFLYWGMDKRIGRRIGIIILMLNVWAPMIKNIVLRRRPYMDHEEIEIKRLVDATADANDIAAQGYSFPSGHSANSAGLLSSLAVSFKKKWITVLAVILPLLVGFSRMVTGAHYPTDVLGGWALGLLATLLITWLDKKIPNRVLFYGLLFLTALPGLFYCKSTDYFSGLGLLIGFIAGTAVEDKYVRFENTTSIVRTLLRVVVGALVFLGLNTVLKLPFSSEFLNSGTYGSLLVRCARYAISAFVVFTVYPIAFKYTAKIGK